MKQAIRVFPKRAFRWTVTGDGRWISFTVFLGFISAFLCAVFWGDLRGSHESLSTTIRNVALVVGGVIAFPIALWRSRVGERQAAIAQQSLLNERYERGAEMLGSPVMAVRLGGLYVIQRLAQEQPEQYHIPAMQLLCAFIRHPPPNDATERVPTGGEYPDLREDVQAALNTFRDRDDKRQNIEIAVNYHPNLTDADLRGADLINSELSHVILDGAKLSGAWLSGTWLTMTTMWGASLVDAHLSETHFWNAELCFAILDGADFTDTDLFGANLSSARFSDKGQNPAKGLTQRQTDGARVDEGEEPDFTGVADASTGDLLVWNGRPIVDEPYRTGFHPDF